VPNHNHSLDSAISAIVTEEVAAALAPYRPTLDRMASLLAPLGGKSKQAQATPSKRQSSSPGRKSRARRVKGGAKKALRIAKTLAVGQAVSYKQGRGDFAATIVAIDPSTGDVLLKRDRDGKEVIRPAFKITAGADAVAKPVREAKKSGKTKQAAKPRRTRKPARKAKAG